MSKVTVYVGLDYHKDSIQVCVMDPSGKILANRPCPNRAGALVALVAVLRRGRPRRHRGLLRVGQPGRRAGHQARLDH